MASLGVVLRIKYELDRDMPVTARQRVPLKRAVV